MSHTNHDTPGFPRALRGPRGGRHVSPTPCAECVSFTSCRPGPCSAPFGCDSWVDFDGRRVDLEAEYAPSQDMTEADLAAVLGTLEAGPAVELTPAEFADLRGPGVEPDYIAPEPPPHADPSVRWDLEGEDIPEPDDPGPLFQR